MGRALLRLSGADIYEFLQGLVTNDVMRVAEGPVYAAMLTPQGKYLADFFLVADKDDILLDVDSDLAGGLEKRLGMYKLRADVQIALQDMHLHRGLGDPPQDGWNDPRHTALGWRAWRDAPQNSEAADWEALRVAHLIPQSGVELTQDSFILECNFEALNGVDFRKGCYVGQEVTARMKHKTELRKGLARVHVQGEAATGDAILADGKPAGTLLTRSGDAAIAYLRFDRAAGEMSAGEAALSRLS